MERLDGAPRAPSIAIKKARTTDAPDLLRLVRAYYRFDHIRFHRPSVERALCKLLGGNAHGRVWIMRDRSKAVGYLVLAFNFDLEFGGLEGLVTDLFVEEKYRGCGLGRRALELLDDYCCSRGITTIELQVERDNVAALAFYRRIGFTRLSRVVMTREVRTNR